MWDEFKLIERQEKIRKLLNHEITIQQHSSLYEILFFRYWKTGVLRSRQETLRLNDLLLEEHQIINSQHFTSFESQQLHLQFQSAFFLMTDDPQSSLEVLYELDNLFQSHVDLWSDNLLYYIHSLTGILQTLRFTEQYDKMDYFLERLQAVATLSESPDLSITYQILEHRLHNFLNLGQQQQALQTILEQQYGLNRDLPHLPAQVQVQLRLTIARLSSTSSICKSKGWTVTNPAGKLYLASVRVILRRI